MASTISKDILKRIRRRGPGSVFTSSDFLSAGSRAAVDQTLWRLARRGVIRRLGTGIYDLPKDHQILGILSPSPDTIARAIARRDNIRIHMSGESAANALGLSTQVPAKIVYLTDGRSRTIRAGNQEIEFHHVPPSQLSQSFSRASLTAAALRYIGKEEAESVSVRGTLRKALKPADKQRLAKSIRYMPTWMQPIMRAISVSGDE